MIVKLLDSTGAEKYSLDVALWFYQSEMNEVVLQLATPKIYVKPAVSVYKMVIYDNNNALVAEYDGVLFKNYSITIDEANVEGVTVPLRFVNNSFRFSVSG